MHQQIEKPYWIISSYLSKCMRLTPVISRMPMAGIHDPRMSLHVHHQHCKCFVSLNGPVSGIASKWIANIDSFILSTPRLLWDALSVDD